MAPNIPQSGTTGRSVWYTGVHSFFRVFEQEVATMLKRVLACTAVLALCALPLAAQGHAATAGNEMTITGQVVDLNCFTTNGASGAGQDRKSTRLNSSHGYISYAVFCLKKK